MAGAVKHARLESRTARRKLERGRQPHWVAVVPQRVHLGWQRWPDDDAGRWVLRRYINGKYSSLTIGRADDTEEANGQRVLSFEQAEAKVRAMLDTGSGRVHRLTVRRALEKYAEFLQSKGKRTDTRGWVHIVPPLGDIVVSELTAEQLRRWLATMAAAPAQNRPKQGGKPQYRPEPQTEEDVRARRASANRVLTILKAALNHAYDEGHVTNRDAWGRKLKPFEGVEIARASWLSVADATRLINATDPKFRPLVQAALETGCRYGELIQLKVSDFNAEAGTLAIRRSKSGKWRHVVLTEEGGVAFFVQQCTGRSGDELMFRRADGSPWKKSHQARPMREACKHAEVKPIVSFHTLRHTWASLAVMNNVPLIVVAKNLGHSDTRMVERHYGHLAESYVTAAIRAGAPRYGVVSDKTVARLTPRKR